MKKKELVENISIGECIINGDFNGNVRKEVNVYNRVYIGGVLFDKE